MSKAKDIARLYKAGNSMKMISVFVGTSIDYIKQVVVLSGIQKKRYLSMEDCNLMVVMANRGVSRSDIATTFEIREETVSRTLRRMGVSMRKGRNAAKPKLYKWDLPKRK